MKVPYMFRRSYSTSTRKILTKSIRNRFNEYFINENNHEFIKPIPLASHFDHSYLCVHSGACQFTRVFSGKETLNGNKFSNFQKCIKTRRKFQEFDVLGQDPHRLLFFEMLNNWSLNAYDKKEACKLAWNLLTSEPFSLPPESLFVSYFKGDETMNLPADEEVREIWLELRVPANHILPCGGASNLWKLGKAEPRGTCTKIYYILPQNSDENNTFSNMIELWNIGFVKYKCIDDILQPLPNEFISAGLGLERLASVLQQTYSSYHTDLIEPLYAAIQKISGAPEYKKSFNMNNLDLKYRQLVDFSRMITAGIADDIFPDMNNEMKRVVHRALLIARTDFKQECPASMLNELAALVVDSLQETYPELGENLNKIRLVIEHEDNKMEEMLSKNDAYWNEAKTNYPVLESFSFREYPEIIRIFKRTATTINNTTSDVLPAIEIVKIIEQYVLSRSTMEKILAHFGRTVDWNAVETIQKEIIRISESVSPKLTPTQKCLLDVGIVSDDLPKHEYVRNEEGSSTLYNFPDLKAHLLAILDSGKILSINVERDRLPEDFKPASNVEVNVDGRELGFIFDKTNFTTEKANWAYDTGFITFDENIRYCVSRVERVEDYVIHYGELQFYSGENVKLKVGSQAVLTINPENRLELMKNNTLTHLIQIALKELFPLVYLKHMRANQEYCQVRAMVFGKEVDIEDCGKQIELKLREYIQRGLPIRSKMLENSVQLSQESDVVLHPGLVYPCRNIKLMSICNEQGDVLHQEPCDNLHVLNTADIGDNILIPQLNYSKYKSLTVYGIRENVSSKAVRLQKWLETQTESFKEEMTSIKNDTMMLDEMLRFSEKCYPTLYKMKRDFCSTPHLITRTTFANMQKLQDITQVIRTKFSKIPSEVVVELLRSRTEELAKNDQAVVYFCFIPIPFFKELSFLVDILYRNEFPTLFFCFYGMKVKGVSHVPANCVRSNFNAEIWMKSTLEGFDNSLRIKEEIENIIFCYLSGEIIEISKFMDYIEFLTVLGRMVVAEKFDRPPEAHEGVVKDQN